MTVVAVGLLVFAVSAFGYVGWSLYRLALRVLRDPDTERLLDGE